VSFGAEGRRSVIRARWTRCDRGSMRPQAARWRLAWFGPGAAPQSEEGGYRGWRSAAPGSYKSSVASKKCFIDKARPCDLTCKAAFPVEDAVDPVDCYFIWLASHLGDSAFDFRRMMDSQLPREDGPGPAGPGAPGAPGPDFGGSPN
jgi:hypothetical protein